MSAVPLVQDSEAGVVEAVVVAEGLVDQGLTASLLGASEAVAATSLQVTWLCHAMTPVNVSCITV